MAKVERHYVADTTMRGSIPYEEASDVRVYREHLENSLPPAFAKICRFGQKNAWVVRDYVNNVICLQSYSTIVAMKAGNTAVSFGKWSMSTTNHQHLFETWCAEHPEEA